MYWFIRIFLVSTLFDGIFKKNKKSLSDLHYLLPEDVHGLSENPPNMKPTVL